MRRSVPADVWVEDDGRVIRREPEYIGDRPRWVLVSPLTNAEVEALLGEEE